MEITYSPTVKSSLTSQELTFGVCTQQRTFNSQIFPPKDVLPMCERSESLRVYRAFERGIYTLKHICLAHRCDSNTGLWLHKRSHDSTSSSEQYRYWANSAGFKLQPYFSVLPGKPGKKPKDNVGDVPRWFERQTPLPFENRFFSNFLFSRHLHETRPHRPVKKHKKNV